MAVIKDTASLVSDTTQPNKSSYERKEDKTRTYVPKFIKFSPGISFEDFPVSENDDSTKAKLILASLDGANMFRTRIRTAYRADTANFAGHYTIAWWGCGSTCQAGVVIDRQTGKMYNLPAAALGYSFKSNSRMLIVNPPDSTFYDDCVYCKPEIFVLNEQEKKLQNVAGK